METIHLVQTYSRGARGALVAAKPLQYSSADEASRRAARLADSVVGVIAYSMDIDEDGGDYSAPRLLFSHGEIPELG